MSFCGAIEMVSICICVLICVADCAQAGIITFSTSIIKGGVEKFALKQPIFLVSTLDHLIIWSFSGRSIKPLLQPSPVDPMYSAKLIFEGISVDIRASLYASSGSA